MTVFGRVTAHLVPEIVQHIPGENCSEKINFLKDNIIIEGIQGEKESWNQFLNQSHQITIGVTATLDIVNVLDTAIAEMTSALVALKEDTAETEIQTVYDDTEVVAEVHGAVRYVTADTILTEQGEATILTEQEESTLLKEESTLLTEQEESIPEPQQEPDRSAVGEANEGKVLDERTGEYVDDISLLTDVPDVGQQTDEVDNVVESVEEDQTSKMEAAPVEDVDQSGEKDTSPVKNADPSIKKDTCPVKDADQSSEMDDALVTDSEQSKLFKKLALVPVKKFVKIKSEKADTSQEIEDSSDDSMDESLEEGEVIYDTKKLTPEKNMSAAEALLSPTRRSARIKDRRERKVLSKMMKKKSRKKKNFKKIVVLEMGSKSDAIITVKDEKPDAATNTTNDSDVAVKQEILSTNPALTGHVRRVNKDEMSFENGEYTCRVCFYSSEKERSVREHILNLHRPKQFPCTKCPKKFITQGSLNKHLIGHGLFCKICKQNFDTDKELEEHKPDCVPRKFKQEEEEFTCSLCSRILPSRGKLNRHVREVHYGMNKRKRVVKTKSEPEDGADSSSKEVASPKKQYMCSICSMGFTDASNRNRHMRETHRNLRTKPGDQNKVHQCNTCGHLCNTEHLLKSHTRIKHDSDQADGRVINLREVIVLNCIQCKYSSSSIRCINEHIDRKHGGLDLECDVCDKKFSSRQAWYLHKKVHGGDDGGTTKMVLSDVTETHVICKHCGMAYLSTEQLRTHIIRDHLDDGLTDTTAVDQSKEEQTEEEKASVIAIKKTSFIIENVKLKSVENIQDHAIFHVGANIHCLWCSFIAHCRTYLNQHIKTCHTVEGRLEDKGKKVKKGGYKKIDRAAEPKEKLMCNICGTLNSNKGLLRRHMKDMHREVVMKESERDPKKPIALLCMLCSKAYGRRNLIISHLSNAHPQIFSNDNITSADIDGYIVEHFSTPFSCLKCHFIGKNERSLNEHVQRSHTDKIFICDECGKGFGVKKDLISHGKVHSRADWPTCEHCGIQKATDNTMRNHILREHLGVKVSYKYEPRKTICPICGKNVYKNNYEGHLNMHASNQPYVCQVCNKAFYCKMKMNRHMRMHDGAEFQCHHCPKVFPTREQWKRHINRHANSRKIKMEPAEQTADQLVALVTEAGLIETQEVQQSTENLIVSIKEEIAGGMGNFLVSGEGGMTLPENVVICTVLDPESQEIVIQSLETMETQ